MQFVKGEIVKSIPGFSSYIISEGGKIYRTKVFDKRRTTRILYPNSNVEVFGEIKSSLNNSPINKALCVALYDNKAKLTTRSVPRLVIDTFGQKLDGSYHAYNISYLDGDPTNCHIDNLEISVKELKGKKVDPAHIPEIHEMLDNEVPIARIALKFGVRESRIITIIRKRKNEIKNAE